MNNNKETIRFIKACLRKEGFSNQLIAYLLSTYDLDSFLNETAMDRLETAVHFISHARHIHTQTSNY